MTAAQAQTKTIAVYVDGQDASRVRAAVLTAVGGGIGIADDKVFRAALTRAGQRKPFGKQLNSNAIERIRNAALAIGADAVLVVRALAGKKSRSVLLIVVDVSEGAGPPKRVPLDPMSRDRDADEIAAALTPDLGRYAPPPEQPEPQPTTAAPEVPPTPPIETERPGPATSAALPPTTYASRAARLPVRKTTAQLVGTSLVDVALGAQATGRQFVYENGISRTPYVYKLFPALTATAGARVFPLAAAGGPWGDIGVGAELSLTHVQGKDLRGALNDTVPISYSFDLCARIRPWSDARLVLIASIGYAFTSFGSVGPSNATLPDVAYRSIRPALSARISFGTFSILAGAAARAVLDEEGISTRFYDPGGYGFDGEIGEAFRFLRRLEARLLARYERYSFTFHPPAGSTFAPGYANDQFYGARLSLAAIF